jgi:ferredoxin
MRVVIDPVKCSAYGTCNEISPEIFKLDDWGYAFVEDDPDLMAQHLEAVRKAAKECPAGAITVEE